MKPEFAPESASRVRLGQAAEFSLGRMQVMPARREVELAGTTRILEPRVMQVLVALAAARPAVVSRDDLARACWGGLNVGDDAINRCIVALRRLARDFYPEPFTIETVPRVGYALREARSASAILTGERAQTKPTMQRILAALVISFALLGIGLLVWQPWKRATTVSVAVVPAAATQDSERLARDLTAKLGMLSDVSQSPARLLDKDGVKVANLLFQVDSSSEGNEVETSLVLLNDKRELLWARDFRRPQAQLADLKQQVAFTAGTVLKCVLEAISDPETSLDHGTLKTYLNACASYAEVNEADYRDLRATFARVTQSAPRFQAAWRRLLVADSAIVRDLNFDELEAASDRTRLERDIAAAAQVNPQMAEIFLARAALAPVSAFSDRIRLADRAVENAPYSAESLTFRSRLLIQVGRMGDAVGDIKKATRLDPLSPATREDLVSVLATAGKIADAKEELRKAEQLWPGAVNVLEARYALHLRYGDPKEAMRLRASGLLDISGAPFHGSFLEARENPSPINVEKAVRDGRSYLSQDPTAIVQLSQTLAAFGREDELFAVLLDRRQRYDLDDLLEVLFRPAFREFHHDPRMMQVAWRIGLLQYWQSSGKWPDFCFEPDLPYDCKRQATAAAH